MGTLKELRTLVADMFSAATEKEDIDKLSKLNNSLDAVEKEQTELENKNAELIKSYKDLVKHTSFNDTTKAPTDPVGRKNDVGSRIDEALKNIIAKKQ